MNYYVPDFGMDSDIITTTENIAAAEEKFDHRLDFAEKKKQKPVEYKTNKEKDRDIKVSEENLKSTEKKLG